MSTEARSTMDAALELVSASRQLYAADLALSAARLAKLRAALALGEAGRDEEARAIVDEVNRDRGGEL